MNWYNKIAFTAAALCLTLAGCKDDSLPPDACLSVDNNYPAAKQFITFTDCSEDAWRIEINFGDGTFSKAAPAQHSYSENGVYIATLSAWSEDGDAKSQSRQKIVVGGDSTGNGNGGGDKPTACFTPQTTVAETGTDILFLNCSLNANSFAWNFDDGASSTEQNPTHAFAASGTFDVTLTATNANGSSDTTVSVIVGQRVLSKIVLKNFDPLNPSGVAWDDFGFPIPGIPTDPDVYVEIKPASGNTLETGIKNNLVTSALPVTWDVLSENLLLSNQDYTVTVYDDEGFQGGPTEMFHWDANLGTQGSNNLIQLSSGSFAVDIQYAVQ